MAVTKDLHTILSLASFSTVPQLWLMSLSSDSTVLRHVVFGRPLFLFPSQGEGNGKSFSSLHRKHFVHTSQYVNVSSCNMFFILDVSGVSCFSILDNVSGCNMFFHTSQCFSLVTSPVFQLVEHCNMSFHTSQCFSFEHVFPYFAIFQHVL